MSKKKVLSVCYMINYKENKNNDGKIDFINKVSIDQDVVLETNIQGIRVSVRQSFYVIRSATLKQHLRSIH